MLMTGGCCKDGIVTPTRNHAYPAYPWCRGSPSQMMTSQAKRRSLFSAYREKHPSSHPVSSNMACWLAGHFPTSQWTLIAGKFIELVDFPNLGISHPDHPATFHDTR